LRFSKAPLRCVWSAPKPLCFFPIRFPPVLSQSKAPVFNPFQFITVYSGIQSPFTKNPFFLIAFGSFLRYNNKVLYDNIFVQKGMIVMIQMLIERFVPYWEDTRNTAVRHRYGILAAAVGILSNIFL